MKKKRTPSLKTITGKRFKKVVENFTCERCGAFVKGSGYTNHCPKCLWSKHVDENFPGDRKSKCQGLMEPVEIDIKHGEYIIIHRCTKCGIVRKNAASPKDNFDKILEIVANQTKKGSKFKKW